MPARRPAHPVISLRDGAGCRPEGRRTQCFASRRRRMPARRPAHPVFRFATAPDAGQKAGAPSISLRDGAGCRPEGRRTQYLASRRRRMPARRPAHPVSRFATAPDAGQKAGAPSNLASRRRRMPARRPAHPVSRFAAAPDAGQKAGAPSISLRDGAGCRPEGRRTQCFASRRRRMPARRPAHPVSRFATAPDAGQKAGAPSVSLRDGAGCRPEGRRTQCLRFATAPDAGQKAGAPSVSLRGGAGCRPEGRRTQCLASRRRRMPARRPAHPVFGFAAAPDAGQKAGAPSVLLRGGAGCRPEGRRTQCLAHPVFLATPPR